ncbi:MAG: HAMP domain-containing histidine kinase [Sandaracinus sp.]|nr:HAMP domain-containing histidine kinase [Sandaracinus sp.]MCB9619063.1 HAMP domain-containing histidine kinase [Sandaracinus sp.]
MIARLVVVAAALTLAASAAAAAVAWLALPWGGEEALGFLRLLGAMNLVFVVWATASAWRRRAALKARRPTEAQIAGLYALPLETALVSVLGLFVVALVDGLGDGVVSGLTRGERLAAASLAFAFQQNASLHLALAWRAMSWRRRLRRLPIERIPVPERPQLALRYALRVASAVVLLAGSVLAVPIAYDASESILPVVAVLGFGGIGAVVGSAIGRRIARDVRVLTTYVRALAAAPEGDVELPSSRLRSSLARDAGNRVQALARRHVQRAQAQLKARRSVEETQRIKTRFLAHMSHDLRAPLHSITGFADLLAEEVDGPLNAEQLTSVRAILESGEVLSQLVTEIVDTARLEAGRLAIHRQPTSLTEVIEEAVERARRSAPIHDLEISVELPDWPPMDVDRERMVQAFVGVLAHVVRMTPNGMLELRGERDGAFCVVTLDAIGLPPEDTQRIFLAFRDLKKPSGGRAGLGIGLSLARQLVEAHGGHLSYTSQGPQGGARFTFELPAPRR